MRSWKQIFYFVKSQQNGYKVLIIIIILLAYVSIKTKENNIILDNITPIEKNTFEKKTFRAYTRAKTINYFPFDPNIVTEAEMLRLGFSKREISNIINYRNKGGKFRVKTDLKKIYTLSEEKYITLEKYINLPKKSLSRKIKKERKAEKGKKKENKKLIIIDINTADTSLLQQIPYIGSKRAKYIIEFREKLGGFADKQQLTEIYSINKDILDTIIKYIILDTLKIRKINLNTTTIKELHSHPYINYTDAKHIIEYRNIVGQIGLKEELIENKIIDSCIYNKIKRYTKLQ